MILVDTSIWVDHLVHGHPLLIELLEQGLVVCHPFVIGELACGRMHNRDEILGLLGSLPQAQLARHEEVLHLIERRQLYGLGLGWVDVHLLGSALLSSCRLWTTDKALERAARGMGVGAEVEGEKGFRSFPSLRS